MCQHVITHVPRNGLHLHSSLRIPFRESNLQKKRMSVVVRRIGRILPYNVRLSATSMSLREKVWSKRKIHVFKHIAFLATYIIPCQPDNILEYSWYIGIVSHKFLYFRIVSRSSTIAKRLLMVSIGNF